jgi:hypothetical protein
MISLSFDGLGIVLEGGSGLVSDREQLERRANVCTGEESLELLPTRKGRAR